MPIQELDGLDELELQIVRQAADIVMGFNADAFENIGIDGSLGQESDIVLLAGFFFKNTDKLGTDDFAFLLRIADAGELVQETVDRIDIDQICFHLVAEDFDDLFGLAFAEKTVIHMNGDQLLPDGADQERGHDGAVDTAGKGEQNLFITDLLPDGGYLFGDEGFGQFGRCDPLHGIGALVVIHVHSSYQYLKILSRYRT